MLSLRPEAVIISDSPGFENVFNASVQEVIFRGDHMRARATLCGNADFIIKVPKAVAWSERLRNGDPISVGWSKKDCRAFAADMK